MADEVLPRRELYRTRPLELWERLGTYVVPSAEVVGVVSHRRCRLSTVSRAGFRLFVCSRGRDAVARACDPQHITSDGPASEAPPVPPLVIQAAKAAAAVSFSSNCRPEVGRLLAVLAASRPGGLLGESGTGYGVGAAWLASGMDPRSRLVTVERDVAAAAAARAVLADDDRVTVRTGDWRVLTQHAPYDLLFCDGGGKRDDPDAVVAMLAPGGILLLDDFVPAMSWPPTYAGGADDLRLRYLTHPLLHATEVRVAEDMAVVLGSRVAG